MSQAKVEIRVTADAVASDSQLAEFGRLHHLFFQRIADGFYGDLDQVLETFGQVIEGQSPAKPVVIESRFPAWRKFHIGGIDAINLIHRITTGLYKVSEYAKDAMLANRLETQDFEEEIDTIVLTQRCLGYNNSVALDHLYSSDGIARLNYRHSSKLPSGWMLDVLPPEAGPHIRDQYRDQPTGENLLIAMRPIVGVDGSPHAFSVVRHAESGDRYLDAVYAGPDHEISVTQNIVFRLVRLRPDA